MVAPPVMVSFAITRRCNLKCPHCYSESVEKPHPKELTTEEAKEVISDVARLGTRMIIFDGGEPTLREDLPELVKHAADEGLTPLLGSNGMKETLSRELLRALRGAGLRAISISLDGAKPETHDSFRGVTGAWESTLKGIENCKEEGITFQIGTTLHKQNFEELPEIIDLAKKLGSYAVEIFEFVEVGRGAQNKQYSLSGEQRREAVGYLIERQLKEEELFFRLIALPQYWIEAERRIEDEEGLLKFVRTCCAAGIRYGTILYDGTIFPCMLLPIPLGNVREVSFSEVWRKNPLLEKLRDAENLKGKCSRCKYREICRGARCKALAKTGDLFAEDPDCWIEVEGAEH